MTDGAQDTTTASTLDAAQALDPRALVALRDNQRQLDQDGVEVGAQQAQDAGQDRQATACPPAQVETSRPVGRW